MGMESSVVTPGSPPEQVTLRGAVRTHRGLKRRVNEDAVVANALMTLGDTTMSWQASWRTDEDHHEVVMVLDGMGGHQGGAVASRLAGTLAGLGLADRPEEGLVSAVLDSANLTVTAMATGIPGLDQMGCTCVGLLIGSRAVTVFNLGDSRAYRFAGGTLGQLTVDDRRASPAGGSMLTQCLGRPRDSLDPHLSGYELLPQQRFLLCSDGLTDYVEQATIKQRMAGQSVESVADALVQETLQAGAPDNVSVAVVEIEYTPAEDQHDAPTG